MKSAVNLIFLISTILFSNNAFSQQKSMNEFLLEAVKSNDFKKVKELVEKKADVNYCDNNKAPIIMWAAYKSNIATVKYLISQKADINKKGVIFLSVDEPAYYGNLLAIAVAEKKNELLKYLIETCNIDIDDMEYDYETKQENGWTALHWAASTGNKEALKYLINKGANINKPDIESNTPLFLACEYKRYNIVEILINT